MQYVPCLSTGEETPQKGVETRRCHTSRRANGHPDMASDKDGGTDGKPFQHNTGNMGALGAVRVGSRSLPLYPVFIVSLGLLNGILIIIAVVIGIYCANVSDISNLDRATTEAVIIEVEQLRIMHAHAIEAQKETEQTLKKEIKKRQQLEILLERNKTLSDVLQKQFETLQLEKATLQADTSDIYHSCEKCLSEWFLLNTTCYFHGKAASSPLKNWHDSRADCIRRGGDLTVIDSLEEQINLFEYLPKVEPNIHTWNKPGIWIGLTEFQTEGQWDWINNVTVTARYWMSGEPNNYGPGGEQCGAIKNGKIPLQTWFDGKCDLPQEWLCEMQPN
ncbi:C-type lectin domain family 4 member M-like [Brachionichthys hirsutus]|uniref:C-type lectin domain family 4 member M-like n=1 Tax=Brachionichthys hirsutus TaxID=412623 RepID=UPI003605364B